MPPRQLKYLLCVNQLLIERGGVGQLLPSLSSTKEDLEQAKGDTSALREVLVEREPTEGQA